MPKSSDGFRSGPRTKHLRAGTTIIHRLLPAALWCATIALGLFSRSALSGAAAKYLGVALWATSVFFLILTIAPRTRPAVALALCLFISWAVEFAQLTDIPRRLSSLHPFLRLVFGEVFHAPDLLALTLGALAAWAIWILLRRILPATMAESAGLERPS